MDGSLDTKDNIALAIEIPYILCKSGRSKGQ